MSDETEIAAIMRDAAISLERAYNEIQHLRNRVQVLEHDLQAKDQELQLTLRKLNKVRQTIRRMEEGEL